MLNWKEWIINYSKRTPYAHIGSYMQRWWIVPYRHEIQLKWWKNPLGWLLQQFDIAIRVHEILKSDDARAKHCHPWNYLTVILKGGYVEITEVLDAKGRYCGEKRVLYQAGDVLYRKAASRHRLELASLVNDWVDNKPEVTTTLFITFRKKKSWGFYPTPDTYVPYQEYLKDHEQ